MSPLVPIRQKKFLRYCKQHGVGLWAVVDVSYDINREDENFKSYGGSKRFPSGCIIQDIGNGCSKVTSNILQKFKSVKVCCLGSARDFIELFLVKKIGLSTKRVDKQPENLKPYSIKIPLFLCQ